MIVDFQKVLDAKAKLSENDLAILAKSPHLDELRGIKAAGGPVQKLTRDAMIGVFDLTSLEEPAAEKGVIGALNATCLGRRVITAVETDDAGEMDVTAAVRYWIMMMVVHNFILENISAISDKDTRESLQERKARTQQAGYMENARKMRANKEMRNLVGKILELEEEDVVVDEMDGCIAYIIAQKELAVLQILETVYAAHGAISAIRVVSQIVNTIRPKLKELISELEQEAVTANVPAKIGRIGILLKIRDTKFIRKIKELLDRIFTKIKCALTISSK